MTTKTKKTPDKSSKRRWFGGRITEHFGEYETDSLVLFELCPKKSLKAEVNHQNKTFRDGVTWDAVNGYYEFDSYLYRPMEFIELTEAEYAAAYKALYHRDYYLLKEVNNA